MSYDNKTTYSSYFSNYLLIFSLSIFLVCIYSGTCHAKKVHTVFFEGTDYELHVYRTYGKEPGKTLLLIGGIQGDEPGGFLSADHYVDFSLSKGNLIVVPRANFASIVLNRRQINDDMNRKFADDKNNNYEAEVVAILKKLINESDMLLNLHDGSGFYSSKWENENRNPMRFGQSIIADCEDFNIPQEDKTIHLGEMARIVTNKINQKIKDPEHYFHFNNHRTHDESSAHKEQRKSATYYALFTCHIPAFGVETSKDLPLEQKVRHHNLAVNGFMTLLNIIPETPGLNLEKPELQYLIISVNDSLPILVEKQQTLYISPGDFINISHIEANYERGVTADILGLGTTNDTRKKIQIQKPTRIVVRKDYYPCGSIYLDFGGKEGRKFASNVSVSGGPGYGEPYLFYRLRINEEEKVFRNHDHVPLIRGDKIVLDDISTNYGDPSEISVNFKGFVGDKSQNTGEDRGFVIDTAKDLWPSYSVKKKGKTYQVKVTLHDVEIGSLFVDIEEPSFDYVVIGTGKNKMHCFTPGTTAFINPGERIQLLDIITNIKSNRGIKAFLACPGASKTLLKMNADMPINSLQNNSKDISSNEYRMDILRDDVIMGSVYLKFFPGDAS